VHNVWMLLDALHTERRKPKERKNTAEEQKTPH
jgi:hypothetical protein